MMQKYNMARRHADVRREYSGNEAEKKGKPRQMRSVVVRDLRDYVRKHWKLLVASMAVMIICYGFLVFCGNIRIDTEELINNPGSTLGWLVIGRWSLVLFKKLLGLTVHNTVASGILFFLFFWLGANLLSFALYHFAERKERWHYWCFLLLYVTSNIWCYQIYFSLQQAEVAFAMLLLVIAAFFAMKACFAPVLPKSIDLQADGWHGRSAWWSRFGIVPSAVLLFLGLGAYQALAAYYIAVCLALFLVMLPSVGAMEADAGGRPSVGATEADAGGKSSVGAMEADAYRGIWRGVLLLIVQFVAAYSACSLYVKYFMVSSDYMESQMGWGRLAFADCVKNILRTAKNVLIGYGPRNFSFYGCGVLLLFVGGFFLWRRVRAGRKEMRHTRLLIWHGLGLVGILGVPFLMTIYMGEMLVTRSQFALPVTAAFLGMYGISVLEDAAQRGGRAPGRLAFAGRLCIALVIIVQVGYDLRLTYTDTVRFREDAAVTDELLRELINACDGDLPEQPVIFVGYRKPELGGSCRRTEMYGWSFYEWDYSVDNPTGATHRIVGFVKAYEGEELNEDATDGQRQAAVEIAETMQDFPAEDSIRVTEDFVVVRLSEITERMDLDWW